MYAKTKTQIDEAKLGAAQLFWSIYENKFRDEYPDDITFLETHVRFVTLTFKQNKISMTDRLGLSTKSCPIQKIQDERARDPSNLKSKQFSELVAFVRRHNINIENPGQLPHKQLLAAILEQTKEPILQRPPVAIRPRPHPLEVFRQFHWKMARACVRNNMDHKIPYQPLAFAYVDFEGTRKGVSVDPLNCTWVHVHAAIFVRPNQIPAYEMFTSPYEPYFKYLDRLRQIRELNKLERLCPLTKNDVAKRKLLIKFLGEPPKLKLSGDMMALHDIKFQSYDADKPLAELFGYSSKGSDHVSVQFVRKDNRVREAVYWGADDLLGIFPQQLTPLKKASN